MALDHPDRVLKLAVLDIIPTGEAFRRANMNFGRSYGYLGGAGCQQSPQESRCDLFKIVRPLEYRHVLPQVAFVDPSKRSQKIA
jgi:hypothetical protein